MTEVIRLEGVHKRFGGIVVAENINLAIGQGDILGLIGPNGAGKTSLFNLISGVVSLDAGSIFLAGQRIDCYAAVSPSAGRHLAHLATHATVPHHDGDGESFCRAAGLWW